MSCCVDNVPTFDVCVYRGSLWETVLAYKPGGDIIDLTNYEAEMKVVAYVGGPEITSLGTDSGEIVTGLFTVPATTLNPEYQYNIKLTLSSVRTLALSKGVYISDLFIKEPLASDQTILAKFNITVLDTVTETVP